MRLIFFCLFFCAGIASVAQDADWNDYRRKNESFSHIYDKTIRADLASFTIGGIEESLGQSPLKKLPVVQFGKDFITFDSNHVRVTIRSAAFNPIKHKMGYEAKHLVKIDNKPFYGDYGRIPPTLISAVTVTYDKDTVVFPPNAFSDLYNPGFTYTDASGNISSQDAVYLSADKRNLYIYMLNRDDSGSYEVTWIIQDKKYLRRILDYGFSK
jgi:hypothetical protein